MSLKLSTQHSKNNDVEAMLECYHDEIVFEEHAFGVLIGEHARNM